MLWARELVVVRLNRSTGLLFLRKQLPSLFGVSKREVVSFTQHLAMLLRSGVALYQAIGLLSEQQSSRVLKSVLQEVMASLQQGQSLSQSLDEHPDIFPLVYSRMVRVGESSGRLPDVLERLALHMVKEQETAAKLRGAMIYPVMIMCLAVGAIYILMTITLPSITAMLREFQSELPSSTQLLMDTSAWMAGNKENILVAGLFAGVLYKLIASTEAGRQRLHLLALVVPLIGSLNRRSAIARLATTTATLLQAGLPLTEVMQLLEDTTGNVILKKALVGVRISLTQGATFYEAMSQSWVFPKMVVQMIRVGEEAGKLEGSLESISDFYEKETDRTMGVITGMIAPILIVFVGGFVGFVFASVISAMYSVYGAIH